MSDLNKLSEQELSGVAGGISPDEAFRRALACANLNLDENTIRNLRKRVEMDFERGVKIYEVNFKYTGLEYDFDINAENGAVLNWERDFDD